MFQGDGCIMMRIKPTDLNIVMPPMEKARLIAEANEAFEVKERVDEQYIHWTLPASKGVSLYIVGLMIDELTYIKKGKV